MSATPSHPGQAVRNAEGHIGIVTESARKSGVYKGKVSVMWVGGRYEVTEDPEDLTLINLSLLDQQDT